MTVVASPVRAARAAAAAAAARAATAVSSSIPRLDSPVVATGTSACAAFSATARHRARPPHEHSPLRHLRVSHGAAHSSDAASTPPSSTSSTAATSSSTSPNLPPLHHAIPAAPSWSTSDLLSPDGAAVESTIITAEKLRQVAKQANINLPTTKTATQTTTGWNAVADGDGDGEEDGSGRRPSESGHGESGGEAGLLRGVNEVLRFVRTLDGVDTDGVEPMWTPLRRSHVTPLRSDEVAGQTRANAKTPTAAAGGGGSAVAGHGAAAVSRMVPTSLANRSIGQSVNWPIGQLASLAGAAAEEGAAGWQAAARDDLLGLAPDSSKSPHYVSPKTAGTEDS